MTAVELMRVRSVLSLRWPSGEMRLNRSGTRENRWLIPLTVFVAHGALVLLATRATRIGQHCALVWLIPFCRIGHIEANGELLEHMRDPKEP